MSLPLSTSFKFTAEGHSIKWQNGTFDTKHNGIKPNKCPNALNDVLHNLPLLNIRKYV